MRVPASAVPKIRREAVLRLPVGTFVKTLDAPPYGSGQVEWTYTEDGRVSGRIVVSVMGVEVDLSTEAEIAMASTGTVYGVVTGLSVNKIRVVGGEIDEEVRAYASLVSGLAEPLMTDFVVDLPFSYRCRQVGDRLVIQNYRILLAGPNPLTRAGPVVGDLDEIGAVLLYFQAIGVAMEGTYRTADADNPAPTARLQRPE